MTTAHFVTIVLNAYRGPASGGQLIHGSHDGGGEPRLDYLEQRVPIFLNLTAKSLAQQTSDDFHVILMHDHRLDPSHLWEGDPSIEALGDRFHSVGVQPIDFLNDLRNAFWKARPAEDEVILGHSQGAKRILITHIDSDDCYRSDAIQTIAAHPAPRVKAIMTQKGYIHRVHTGEVAEWEALSPPFYSLQYDRELYANGLRYHGGLGHHSYVGRELATSYIDDRLFCVNVHGTNDSTRFAPAGRTLSTLEAFTARQRFGLAL